MDANKPYVTPDGNSIVFQIGNYKIAYPIDKYEASELFRKGEVR